MVDLAKEIGFSQEDKLEPNLLVYRGSEDMVLPSLPSG